MKFGVIIFPGSNCDHDAYWTIQHVAKQPVTFLRAIKRASLIADVNVLAYDPRDHFDFAYIAEGWSRVQQRLATGNLPDFAYALHAVADFHRTDRAPRRARWVRAQPSSPLRAIGGAGNQYAPKPFVRPTQVRRPDGWPRVGLMQINCGLVPIHETIVPDGRDSKGSYSGHREIAAGGYRKG